MNCSAYQYMWLKTGGSYVGAGGGVDCDAANREYVLYDLAGVINGNKQTPTDDPSAGPQTNSDGELIAWGPTACLSQDTGYFIEGNSWSDYQQTGQYRFALADDLITSC